MGTRDSTSGDAGTHDSERLSCSEDSGKPFTEAGATSYFDGRQRLETKPGYSVRIRLLPTKHGVPRLGAHH